MREDETRPRLDAEITEGVLARLGRAAPGYWLAVLVLGVLVLLGLIGLLIRLAGGLEQRAAWGYFAAIFAYLLSTAQAAPLIVAALRFAKADWRRPLARPIELLSLTGIVSFLLYLPLQATLPPLKGRTSIWFDWPWGAPGFFDGLALALLALTGLAILFFSAVPDFAAARDRGAGGLYARLAGGWRGTRRQWHVLQTGLVYLGAFYVIEFVFVHFLVSSDFAMSLVPGWRSAIFPAYHAVTGFQGGVATTIITLALLRRFGGLERYLGLDQFWGLAKILLALSLFWFYFWWSDFFTHWYGRTPREIAILELLNFGPYLAPFLLASGLSFVAPFLLLIWNRIRTSINGPTVVAIVVLTGLFFDRIRLYVSAYSVPDPTGHELALVPPTHFPDLVDAAMMVGALAAVPFVYLLALRVVPIISLWEVKEGLLLRVTRRFLRSEVTIIGKPR